MACKRIAYVALGVPFSPVRVQGRDDDVAREACLLRHAPRTPSKTSNRRQESCRRQVVTSTNEACPPILLPGSQRRDARGRILRTGDSSCSLKSHRQSE